MKRQLAAIAAVSPFLVALTLAGCSSGESGPPPQSVMAPRQSAPPKPAPTTMDEKIERINAAPMSPAEKKAAIERVRSGNL